MVFFGDIARDLIGKPVDVLLSENCALLSAVPDEISGLIGRDYVVDVAVSRYSFQKDDISFQVLKFYPQGSSVFAGFRAPSHLSNVPVKIASGSSAGAVDASLSTPFPAKDLVCVYVIITFSSVVIHTVSHNFSIC
jgi:replication factor A1